MSVETPFTKVVGCFLEISVVPSAQTDDSSILSASHKTKTVTSVDTKIDCVSLARHVAARARDLGAVNLVLQIILVGRKPISKTIYVKFSSVSFYLECSQIHQRWPSHRRPVSETWEWDLVTMAAKSIYTDQADRFGG